jgi:hypothetical protein
LFLSIFFIFFDAFFILCFFTIGVIFVVGAIVVVFAGATGVVVLIGAAKDVSVIDDTRSSVVTKAVMIGVRIDVWIKK